MPEFLLTDMDYEEYVMSAFMAFVEDVVKARAAIVAYRDHALFWSGDMEAAKRAIRCVFENCEDENVSVYIFNDFIIVLVK